MTPTDAGERLLRHARRASAAMRAAEADLHALAVGDAGTVRVGTFQSVGVRLLPGAMRRYVERWPDVEVRLLEAGYDEELLTLLERGEIDLAFVRENEIRLRAGRRAVRPVRPARTRRLGARPGWQNGPPTRDRRTAVDRLSPFDRRRRGLPPIPWPRPRGRLSLGRGGTVQGLVGAGIGYAVVPLLAVETSPTSRS